MASTPDVVRRTGEILGRIPMSWSPAPAGYTPAERWIVRFGDGTAAFAKAGVTLLTARFLRAEARFYVNAERSPVRPDVLAWDDGDGAAPILVLEDLSDADWPPPWDADRVQRVRAALDAAAGLRVPVGIPSLDPSETLGWWVVAQDPGPLLSLGLCTEAWLTEALPALLEADDPALLSGGALVHNDVRSDNVCFRGERTVLVDWSHVRVGNPLFDLAFWLPSLAYEGGPAPAAVAPEAAPLAGIVAGFFAARAGLPDIPDAPFVRRVQREQLTTALPWAVRSLGLAALDGPDAGG